jgi:hypothetical protein
LSLALQYSPQNPEPRGEGRIAKRDGRFSIEIDAGVTARDPEKSAPAEAK